MKYRITLSITPMDDKVTVNYPVCQITTLEFEDANKAKDYACKIKELIEMEDEPSYAV